jgi:hypothetical protein
VVEPVIAPLTGQEEETSGSASRAALAMKVDNAPEARPQAGIDTADVVYEEVVEGGVTRLIAVFHSGAPDEVGPLRSVRPMDPNILASLNPLMAYSGGIPEFISLIRKSAIQDVSFDVATGAYHRGPGRKAPHNLFANPTELWEKANPEHTTPPAALFEFRAEGEPFGDAPAASIKIPFSQRVTVAYTWDAANGTWRRVQNGTPHLAADNQQVAPHNVVVQMVGTRNLRYKDQSGSPVTESLVIGRGDAYFFSGGRTVKGKWSEPDDASVTSFTDPAGAPVKLAPGRTWIELAPTGTNVTNG